MNPFERKASALAIELREQRQRKEGRLKAARRAKDARLKQIAQRQRADVVLIPAA